MQSRGQSEIESDSEAVALVEGDAEADAALLEEEAPAGDDEETAA